MKLWTVYIRDQTARSVKSGLDLPCPQKLLLRKELKVSDNDSRHVVLWLCVFLRPWVRVPVGPNVFHHLVFTSLQYKSFENTLGKG